MQKKFYRANLLLLLCAMICLVCYDIYGGLWLKGFTSFWFALLGFVNTIYAWKSEKRLTSYVIIVELGLICGMCADVLLGINFIVGVLFFAIGHILYLAAFYTLEKFSKRDLFIIFFAAAVSIYVVMGTPYITIEDPFMKKLLLGYAVIIACMLGKAVSNIMVHRSVFRWAVLIGSVMFWFSDFMLAIDMFGQSSRLVWLLCSYSYWPAQNILALSLFLHIRERSK